MVRTKQDGAVLVVIIDRPERRNAIDQEHADALAEVEAFASGRPRRRSP
jgi:enoyl-CoA hydratase/carnithine racemase